MYTLLYFGTPYQEAKPTCKDSFGKGERKDILEHLETAPGIQILRQNDWLANTNSQINNLYKQKWKKEARNDSRGSSMNGKMRKNTTMLPHMNATRDYLEKESGFYKGIPFLKVSKYPQSVKKEWTSSYYNFRRNTSTDPIELNQQQQQQQQNETYGLYEKDRSRPDLHHRLMSGHKQTSTKETIDQCEEEDKVTKTTDCFTSLVLTAMESMPGHHMTRDQICTWLLENFQGFTEFPLYHMQNKVTATLYLTGFFFKCCNKVAENGQYWTPISRQHTTEKS